MNIKCNSDNPFSQLICNHILQFTNHFKIEDNETLVEVLSKLVYGGKNLRYGPIPNIEGQYRIREIIRKYTSANLPIPVLVPWGSIKSDFSSDLDIAELHALISLANMNKSVKEYYSPGLDINIRIEDLSGIHLFSGEKGYCTKSLMKYSENLANLITLLGLTPYREIDAENAKDFNQTANDNYHYMYAYLIDSNKYIFNPDMWTRLDSYKDLQNIGWQGIIPIEQRNHYLSGYSKIYGDDEEKNIKRLAVYLSESLARRQCNLTGAKSEWNNDFLQMTFVQPIKGLPTGYSNHYLYYRTIPMNQSRTHMPAWRGKGYFQISGRDVKSKLTSFNNIPEGLETLMLSIEHENISIPFRADYLIID